MTYKFEKLEIYQLALDYLDLIYALADRLPRNEEFNLRSQMIRAGTSIVLNIAEGSTGQTDPEQSRFLGIALPCCCIKFGAQIHQTFGYQGTTLKSMSSAGLIKW